MRTLTEELVVAATHTPLSQLDFLHLDWKDVETLSEALNLPALVSLSISHNALRSSLLPLRRCTELWFLNLSHNKLASLDGLQSFSGKPLPSGACAQAFHSPYVAPTFSLAALGHLDLSHNALKLDELKKLREVDIVHLSLEGNRPLARSLLAGHRAGVLAGSFFVCLFFALPIQLLLKPFRPLSRAKRLGARWTLCFGGRARRGPVCSRSPAWGGV